MLFFVLKEEITCSLVLVKYVHNLQSPRNEELWWNWKGTGADDSKQDRSSWSSPPAGGAVPRTASLWGCPVPRPRPGSVSSHHSGANAVPRGSSCARLRSAAVSVPAVSRRQGSAARWGLKHHATIICVAGAPCGRLTAAGGRRGLVDEQPSKSGFSRFQQGWLLCMLRLEVDQRFTRPPHTRCAGGSSARGWGGPWDKCSALGKQAITQSILCVRETCLSIGLGVGKVCGVGRRDTHYFS